MCLLAYVGGRLLLSNVISDADRPGERVCALQCDFASVNVTNDNAHSNPSGNKWQGPFLLSLTEHSFSFLILSLSCFPHFFLTPPHCNL